MARASRAAAYGRAAAATSQPLATSAALDALRAGGNAADAAVAAAAALAVTEPCSNGAGGDCFALVYRARDRSVHALHACGPAPASLTLAAARAARDPAFPARMRPLSARTVTAPGAPAGWHALHARFGGGHLPLARLLRPAAALARRGFPVAPATARAWRDAEHVLRASADPADPAAPHPYLPAGRAPRVGELFRNPDLADTLDRIADLGVEAGFYHGPVADAVAAAVSARGAPMTPDDVAAAWPAWVGPAVSSAFRDNVVVHQAGAPTHGAAVLLALNLVERAAPDGLAALDARRASGACADADADADAEAAATHVLVDAVRVAYADAAEAVGDAGWGGSVDARFACKEYAARRAAALLGPTRAGGVRGEDVAAGMRRGGTVQFAVVDAAGNAVSMVQSNYCGFGTGIVPARTGFTLHNRGLGFSLEGGGHANAAGPRRRPYHTIIPALLTDARDGALRAALGCMGSFMQPQGHVQLIAALVERGDDAQAAVERARWRVRGGFARAEAEAPPDDVALEAAAHPALAAALRARGHAVVERADAERGVFFGRAQVITRDAHGVVCAGSDPRADGCAGVLA